MKSLNFKQLDVLTKSLDESLKGNHISNIVLFTSSNILFTFSFYRKHKLLISLNHQAPFVSLVDQNVVVSSILNKLSDDLRKHVKDSVIKEIKTLNNDRIIEISLQKSDEFYVRKDFHLVLELIPHHPNLIYLDENRKIIFATHYSDLSSSRAIIKGMNYTLPINNFNGEELTSDLSTFYQDANEYLPSLMNARHNEKYHSLIITIKRKQKIAINKEDALVKEIASAKEKLVYQEYGTCLLTLKDDEESLKEYISSNSVPYDDSLSVSENANRLFKLYKKNKETIRNNEIQLEENKALIDKFNEDLSSLKNADESLFLLLSSMYLKTSIPRQEINKLTPYYVTIDGTKIGFGRNASQNDLLTFKKGKDNNYFLHLQDYHANHVVILKNNANDNDLENAAELCLALASKDAGTIQYALIKDIKKGKFPGQVLFSTYSTIKINNVSNKVKNSLTKTKRINF